METVDNLKNELASINKWEKEQGDLWFWEKLSRLPFKILDKWTPAFIQNKIGQLLDEMGNYIQSGGTILSNVSSVKKYYQHLSVASLDEVRDLPIDEMKKAGEKIAKSRKNWATFQGASTGIGGFLTLSLDIPVLLAMQIKLLQDIAICHGYNPNEKKERIFIVKCLQFVSADIVGKKTILEQLSAYDQNSDQVQREVISEIQGWREVVYAYRDSFGWKKLFQMVPVIGIVFGAFSNRSSMETIAEAAIMFYRKRRIVERLTVKEIE
ncbi:EcsC family protein [Niallia sp. 01092]|uniref:EcsC family protein n=1 Tax=unclassified Niallia TaxID=2837522 RepID=UPI003FD35DB0